MVTDDELLALLCWARYAPPGAQAEVARCVRAAIAAGRAATALPREAAEDFGRAVARDLSRPAPAPKKPATLPACAWRGALLDRCQCGDPLRDVWECREPGMLAPGGGPGKATGRLCAGCKRAQNPGQPRET